MASPIVPRQVDFIPTEDLMAMNPIQLRSLIMKCKPGDGKKGPWSPEESQRLVTLVRLMGPQDWVSIASYMTTRNAKQCRERYHQNLDPALRHDPITDDEARLIMELYNKYGTAWARIAEHLPGRSDNAIKNYVNGLVNKNRRAEERQAGNHSAARRRGSGQSVRSGASPSVSHSVSAALSSSSSSSSSPSSSSSSSLSSAVTAMTPSPFGYRPLESPTFSDMTESDGGNHYALSSTLPWGKFTPYASPPRWHQPLAQSPELAHPIAYQPTAHHPTPYRQQPAYEAPPFGQNVYGFIQKHETHSSMDLARYSISGPVLREPTREVEMQDYQLPTIHSLWTGNDMSHRTVLPTPEKSAVAMPAGHQADPRMSIVNLLT